VATCTLPLQGQRLVQNGCSKFAKRITLGNRFREYRAKKAGVTFTGLWRNAHEGRWYKRKLHKARRQAWKRGVEGVPDNWYESMCNWKGWENERG